VFSLVFFGSSGGCDSMNINTYNLSSGTVFQNNKKFEKNEKFFWPAVLSFHATTELSMDGLLKG